MILVQNFSETDYLPKQTNKDSAEPVSFTNIELNLVVVAESTSNI